LGLILDKLFTFKDGLLLFTSSFPVGGPEDSEINNGEVKPHGYFVLPG
jgi:hypothetical protein